MGVRTVSVRINGDLDALVRGRRRARWPRRRAARLGDRAQGREPRRHRAGGRAARRGRRGEGASGRSGSQALIESARGLRDVNEIAEASPRLEALILGPADMSVSLGFPSPEEGPHWDFVRGAVLVAARAAGLQAIDGPFLQIADDEGLRASAGARARARLRRQVGASSRPDRAAERALLPDRRGGGAGAGDPRGARRCPATARSMLDGEMIDEASRKRAEALLARAGRGETVRGGGRRDAVGPEFSEGSRDQRELLGGKGAGVAEMTRVLGAERVPAGFTITTEACVAYMEAGASCRTASSRGRRGARRARAREPARGSATRRTRCWSRCAPARASRCRGCSTRSSTSASTTSRSAGSPRSTGDERFAWDSYRRFVQMFGDVVCGIPSARASSRRWSGAKRPHGRRAPTPSSRPTRCAS